jgi:DedD protein
MRQRLIGALVLLCGGVILWSLLFTGPAALKIDRHSQIPMAPEIVPIITIEPQKPEDIVPADTLLVPPQPLPAEITAAPNPKSASKLDPKPEAVKSAPKAVEVATRPQKPGLDSNGLPAGWVIQVGVFGNSDNANALKKSLQASDYKAFIDQVLRNGKTLHRVLVGPVLSEKQAQSQQAAINKRFQVKSMVNRFEP